MRPNISMVRRALIALVLVGSMGAFAQAEVAGNQPPPPSTSSRPVGEAWAARLRYGIAYRSGGQQDLGPGLSYSGVTPNDLSLQGWVWFSYFGIHAGLQREAFGLFDAAPSAVTSGGLIRFAGQVAGRFPIGPLRLEPYAGYGLAQLPTFRGGAGDVTSLTPQFAAATRHAVLLAARLLLELGPVQIEGRAELPIALSTSVPGAVSTASNGFAAGGGVRVQAFNVGNLHVGALVDAMYVADNLVGKDSAQSEVVASQQRVVRAGVGLDLQWKDVVVVSKLGGVVVRVVDVDTNVPLPGAEVSITSEGEERPMSPDAAGALAARELKPGPFTLRASAEGYLPFESAGSVVSGTDTPIELKLKKEPPKVGGLTIAVKELDTNKPLANATVTLNDQSSKSDANGMVKVENLKPGPVAIAVSLEGYQKAEEAASVAAGKTSAVAIALVPEKKRVPATITGLVRSTKGGTAIAADLEIPQAKIKTKANDKGSFSFRVEGGTYTVKISAPGYLTQTKDVTVKDGDSAIFNVELYPK